MLSVIIPELAACLWIWLNSIETISFDAIKSAAMFMQPIHSSCPVSPNMINFDPVLIAFTSLLNNSPSTIDTSSKMMISLGNLLSS